MDPSLGAAPNRELEFRAPLTRGCPDLRDVRQEGIRLLQCSAGQAIGASRRFESGLAGAFGTRADDDRTYRSCPAFDWTFKPPDALVQEFSNNFRRISFESPQRTLHGPNALPRPRLQQRTRRTLFPSTVELFHGRGVAHLGREGRSIRAFRALRTLYGLAHCSVIVAAERTTPHVRWGVAAGSSCRSCRTS